MSILIQRNQLDQDLNNKDQLVLSVGEAVHHLAATLISSNEQFWSLETNRLLSVLNHDVSSTIETFRNNTILGTAVNVSLDALDIPQFSKRAPVEPKRLDIIFNGEEFVYVAPTETYETPES